MSAGSAYIVLEHLPVLDQLKKVKGVDSSPVLHGALAAVLLLALGAAVRRAYRDDRILPQEKSLSIANLMEMAVGWLLSFMRGIMGDEARRFVPLVGATGLFILFCNLLGSVPGFDSPTANLNTTLACALVVFFATHYVGARTHGFAYFKHFLGPVWWLIPLMLPLEIISHLARVISLSLRLFGNIFGDHMVFATFLALVPLLVPVVFLGLGMFVAFIQAFVFMLLSTIYIGGALEEAHH
jgi:F-type H+-transporting ATPase subunit a